jgi:hypothetical protein
VLHSTLVIVRVLSRLPLRICLISLAFSVILDVAFSPDEDRINFPLFAQDT